MVWCMLNAPIVCAIDPQWGGGLLLKASDDGRITVTTSCVGHEVEIRVSDTGTGIPEESRRRIFEPFFTTKDVGKGTGLGMSLSFSIIQKHGGTIQVRSVVGEGTAIRVWLLVAGPAAQGKETNPPVWNHNNEHVA